MGLTVDYAAFLLKAFEKGVSFSSTLTLGRQTNYLSNATECLFRTYNFPANIDRDIINAPYAEAFFKHVLNAKDLKSLDYSNYEGADILHDMNNAVPEEWHNRYDVIIESGTLEHIFNVPVAIRNCMNMLRKGGHIFLCVPMNNFFGHGLYQFSPDFFYQLFTLENGFKIQSFYLIESWFQGVERGTRKYWYEVLNPENVGKRVTLINKYPTFAMLQAEKVNTIPALLKVQQSDYTVTWENAKLGSKLTTKRQVVFKRSPIKHFVAVLISILPESMGYWLRSFYERIRFHSIRKIGAPTDISSSAD